MSSTERSVTLWLSWTNESCTLEMMLDKKSDGFKSIKKRLENEVWTCTFSSLDLQHIFRSRRILFSRKTSAHCAAKNIKSCARSKEECMWVSRGNWAILYHPHAYGRWVFDYSYTASFERLYLMSRTPQKRGKQMQFHACDNRDEDNLFFLTRARAPHLWHPRFLSLKISIYARRKKRSENCQGFRWYNWNTSGIYTLKVAPLKINIVIKQLYY